MLDIERIRQDIPSLERSIYLNTGGVAPITSAVFERLEREFKDRYLGGSPLNHRPQEFQAEKDETRTTMADFLGVSSGELCFTRGVSDGAHIVIRGMRWQSGDEIILTDEEYPSFILPAIQLKQRYGVEIKVLKLANDRDIILQRLEALLSPRTRLVAVSHVTTDVGLRLPASEICEIAHRAGVPVLLDGAQAVGQFPIDLRQIDCDYYGMLSYKWMLGPYTAGVLYVREDHVDELVVDRVGARAELASDLEAGTFELLPTAQRFEFGPLPWPLYFGMAEAARYLEKLGLAAIEETVRNQVDYLVRGLKSIPGVRIDSPQEPSLRTGMVAFSLAGWAGKDVSQTLRRRWNIITRATHMRFDGVRVCVALFTTTQELDTVLEAIGSLAEARS